MTNAEIKLPSYGEEVIFRSPGHPQDGEIGVYIGLNYTGPKPRARVRIEGDVHLCDPAGLLIN